MADLGSIVALKTAIEESIYQNDAGLVTADVLQDRLIDMIDTLDALEGYIDKDYLENENDLAGLKIGANEAATQGWVQAQGYADDSDTTTALAAKADKNATVLGKSGTYQVAAADNNKIIECNGTFTVTLPNGLDTGFQCVIVNIGAGTITIAAATTLQSKDANTKLASQYGAASVYHRGTNVWLAVGDLSA